MATRKKKLPQHTKGKSWTLKIVHPRQLPHRWGECRFDTRELVLTTDTEKHGIARQTFLHEMLHKLMPWMDEDAVDNLATQLDESLDVAEFVITM